MSGCEVATLGDINVDVLMSIPAYPPPGGDATTEHIVTRVGGSAANTAIVLAKLGVAVRLIGRVGKGLWADLALRALSESGVDIAAVQRDLSVSTGIFFIPVTPDGERTMFGYRGANARTDPAAIDRDTLDDARILHVSGYALLESPQREAAGRAIELAQQNGIAISLDMGLPAALNATGDIRRLLPRLSICVLGVDEARALVDAGTPSEAASALIDRGVQVVGLKLGAAGCVIADASRIEPVPALDVAAVDTTGAGDAFGAGLIFGWLRGLSLPATGRLATALGSLATTAWGAGPALPGRTEVIDLLHGHLSTTGSNERATWITEVLTAIET